MLRCCVCLNCQLPGLHSLVHKFFLQGVGRWRVVVMQEESRFWKSKVEVDVGDSVMSSAEPSTAPQQVSTPL